MLERFKNSLVSNPNFVFWGTFFGKTVFYLVVLFLLLYFYHFSHLDGSGFIYNEF